MWSRSLGWLCAAVLVTLSTTAHAGGGTPGTISGTVEAKPAKFLGETVVYLKQAAGKSTAKTAAIAQKGMEFSPHVVVIVAGDSVKFENDDKVDHSVMSPDGEKFDLGTWGAGQSKLWTAKQTGAYSILCKLHPEMLAYVFVAPSPYAAVVDASGAFTIANVPPGTYDLMIWNSHLKATSQKVIVKAGDTATAHFALKR